MTYIGFPLPSRNRGLGAHSTTVVQGLLQSYVNLVLISFDFMLKEYVSFHAVNHVY